MKRFHVHVSVDDIEANVRIYSTVFGTPPTVLKPDYAKWMLEDPRINFAISKRGIKSGVDHLGVQVESETELTALRDQVAAAEIDALDQPMRSAAMRAPTSTGRPIRKELRGKRFIRSTRFRLRRNERTQTSACCVRATSNSSS